VRGAHRSPGSPNAGLANGTRWSDALGVHTDVIVSNGAFTVAGM